MQGLSTFCWRLKLFITARDQQFEMEAGLDMKFNKLRVEMHKAFSQAASDIFYQIGANLNCTLE